MGNKGGKVRSLHFTSAQTGALDVYKRWTDVTVKRNIDGEFVLPLGELVLRIERGLSVVAHT